MFAKLNSPLCAMGPGKINIGRFVNKMQWLQPVPAKTETGDTITEYRPCPPFLSEITEEGEASERIDDALSTKTILKFTAWRYDITTEWKLLYNGKEYDVDKIIRERHEMYAKYECSKIEL